MNLSTGLNYFWKSFRTTSGADSLWYCEVLLTLEHGKYREQ